MFRVIILLLSESIVTQILISFYLEFESPRENLGWVDVFIFDHVRDHGGDGRGLSGSCASEDQLGGLGVFDGEEQARF